MQTLRVSEKAGSDGILHLRIPVGQPDAEYEAVVVLQPCTNDASGAAEAVGWPPGYFEETFGSIRDEAFVRPSQGDLPKAVELESSSCSTPTSTCNTCAAGIRPC